ncbi:MAG: hypothetical protein FH761_06515 [Firmicutes bacterium]|nr:hypothetical protein [Bacillota bacterium]
MSKFNLVIADSEEAYVDALSNYIVCNYPEKFNIVTFTEKKLLIDYIDKSNGIRNIILFSNEFYCEEFYSQEDLILINLVENSKKNKDSNINSIYKYQVGNKIVKNIFNIIAEGNLELSNINDSFENKTKVISVFSPNGGAGKTSIAVGSSMIASDRGKKVFYLNLETLQSTPLFFNCDSATSFSEVIYYMKEKKKNLSIKIEAIANRDSINKIHFFAPPESSIDLKSSSVEEITLLLEKLKDLSQYDVIVIDMSSDLNDQNLSILAESNEIFLVVEQNKTSIEKLNSFIKDIEIISSRRDVRILEKTNVILNKYDPKNKLILDYLKSKNISLSFSLPKSMDMFLKEEDGVRINPNSLFASKLWDLVDLII